MFDSDSVIKYLKYLAIPALVAFCSSCSITKNMTIANSCDDLEYRVNAGKVTEESVNNLQRGIDNAFEKKCIPYQTLIANNKPYEFGHNYSMPK